MRLNKTKMQKENEQDKAQKREIYFCLQSNIRKRTLSRSHNQYICKDSSVDSCIPYLYCLSLCEFTCVLIILSYMALYLCVLHILWFLHSFIPTTTGFSEPWEEGFAEDTLFRTEKFRSLTGLHNVWLWICISLHLPQEVSHLMTE